MVSEHHDFLKIVRDYIAQENSVLQSDIYWKDIFHFAELHQLDGVVYFQCKQYYQNTPEWNSIRNRYYQIVADYNKKLKEYTKIASFLESRHIPFFVLKGFECAAVYPQPVLRTMGDIDIVLYPEGRNILHNELLQGGYKNTVHEDKEWVYFKNNIEIELHDELLYDDSFSATKSRLFFKDFWNHVKIENAKYSLDVDYYLIYLITHMYKHLMYKGVGLRQYVDLSFFVKVNEIDWEFVQKELERISLFHFSEVILTLCKSWFDVDTPLGHASLDDEFLSVFTKKTIEGGVFGFNNKQLYNGSYAKEVSESSLPALYMVRNLCGRIFPKYNELIKTKRYSFIKNKPFLLPLAWIYRWIFSIFGKNDSLEAKIKSSFISKNKLDEELIISRTFGI